MGPADWIIDLRPGAGHDGARIVFEGTPSDLVAAKSRLTGEQPGGICRQPCVDCFISLARTRPDVVPPPLMPKPTTSPAPIATKTEATRRPSVDVDRLRGLNRDDIQEDVAIKINLTSIYVDDQEKAH